MRMDRCQNKCQRSVCAEISRIFRQIYRASEFTRWNPKGGCALINTFMTFINASVNKFIDAFKNFLSENIKLLLVGMVAILMVISAAIMISLYFGGDVTRRTVISEISGSAYITRDGKRLRANKNSYLQSGDILSTEANGSVRIAIDDDKYIFVEPDSYLYIYYTDIASKGDISVNLSRGAVICQLNDPLKKNATFMLKTPNSTVDVRGTVFRTEFDFYETHMGYSNVMMTQVQNFDGTVNLQLYDSSQDPFDLPMVLMERTAAQMITADGVCQYGYLNYNIDLLSLSEMTLREILRSGNETELAFSSDEINAAYISAINKNKLQQNQTDSQDNSVTSETTTVTTTGTTSVSSTTTTTESSSGDTSTWGTTRQTHVYTTYTGVKWWELTGNANTDDNYEDWFADDQNDNIISETVTAGTSAES